MTGKLLSRQRVPRKNDPGSHLTVHDFNVNRPVIIFGRQHFIYKCDQFTRDLLTKMGIEVPPDLSPPFSQHLLDSAAVSSLSSVFFRTSVTIFLTIGKTP